ncbi:translation initiation factor IF-3, partial [bacterium]|nr:translation initiation factor IF-3 [bacterium]
FRGREIRNVDLGAEILNKIKEKFIQRATIERDVKREGRVFHMILSPKK